MYEDLLVKYYFQTSHIELKVDFPLTLGLNYYIMPGFITDHSFDLIENNSSLTVGEIEQEETFYAAAFKHGISYENIQWQGQMRSGYSASLDNRWEIHLEEDKPPVDLDFSLNGYAHLGDLMGFSLGFSGFYIFNDIRDNAGDKLRGIEDQLVYGQWGLYVNSGLAVKSISIPPVVELQLQPFVDWGYTINPGEGLVEVDNFYLSGGFSLLVFPLFVRNLQFSAILGYDLLQPGPFELGLYSGLFF
jgi:hypothetical protein